MEPDPRLRFTHVRRHRKQCAELRDEPPKPPKPRDSNPWVLQQYIPGAWELSATTAPQGALRVSAREKKWAARAWHAGGDVPKSRKAAQGSVSELYRIKRADVYYTTLHINITPSIRQSQTRPTKKFIVFARGEITAPIRLQTVFLNRRGSLLNTRLPAILRGVAKGRMKCPG